MSLVVPSRYPAPDVNGFSKFVEGLPLLNGERALGINGLPYKDIWDGATPTVPELSNDGTLISIKGNHASDVPAGTGARTVIVMYIDENGDYQEFFTVTPGNATVALGVKARCVIALIVDSVGTGGVPAGNLEIVTTAGAVQQCFLPVGYNKSHSPIFMVPRGYKAKVVRFQAGLESVFGEARGEARIVADMNLSGTLNKGIYLPFAIINVSGLIDKHTVWFPEGVTIRMQGYRYAGAVALFTNGQIYIELIGVL